VIPQVFSLCVAGLDIHAVTVLPDLYEQCKTFLISLTGIMILERDWFKIPVKYGIKAGIVNFGIFKRVGPRSFTPVHSSNVRFPKRAISSVQHVITFRHRQGFTQIT